MKTTEKPYVVGVDIGGQTSKIGIVDRRGTIISQTVISSIYESDEAYKFIETLCNTIKDLAKEVGLDNIHGIGIGAPKANYYKGTIEDASNLAWANGKVIELTKEVSSKLNNIPATLTNDANAAAVGEMTYGAALGMKNFIMITLGTGVGSGIVVDGKVLYGHDGFAGELGHSCAVKGGRQCNCGKKGCLETYTSAIGVSRTTMEILTNSKEPSLLRDVEGTVTSKDVYDAAKQGDELALKIFQTTGEMLGESFADFVAFSAPEAIVLFGGLARAQEFILPAIEKAMNDNLLSIWKGKVKLIVSALKESDTAILGASALAW